jgi:hypothetical protein
MDDLEAAACIPSAIHFDHFNLRAEVPYGCTLQHLYAAMNDFIEFLGFINHQLYTKGLQRLENLLMPANFSSVVGEFISANIPKHCHTLAKNQYHNGHPDLIPAGAFKNNAVQHSDQGIEIKASRYSRGWQGHNPENTWLMVFVFDSNRPNDAINSIDPKPFQFLTVVGAKLERSDWTFSGRSTTSRRTITASVNKTG